MTKVKINPSKEVKKSDSKKVELKKEVLKANNELIAFSTLQRKSLSDYLNLSLTECKQINALLIKKEKHYLPKGTNDKEAKTYRSANRKQIEKLESFFIKGEFQNNEKSLNHVKALRKFILCHYNIDLKAIDLKSFDKSLIYSNAKHMDNLFKLVHLM